LITIVGAFFGTECATSLGISTSFAMNLNENHVAVEVSFKKILCQLDIRKIIFVTFCKLRSCSPPQPP